MSLISTHFTKTKGQLWEQVLSGENVLGGSDGKVSAYKVGDPDSIPGSRRYPGEGNGNLPQYFRLGNPMDRGTSQATVYGAARVRHDLATKPPPPVRLSTFLLTY